MKKLLTVTWSRTVEVEIPVEHSNVTIDDLESYEVPKDLAKITNEAVQRASSEINWKDGIVTDVQDV